VTTATDVYGLGAILYALLTGHAPFQGAGVAETLDLVRTQPPEPPHVADGRVPRDLEVICLKCLEKEPARRYPTAAALAEDLRRFAAGEPIAARPVGALERGRLWCRRNPTVATLGALFLLALVIGTITSITFAVLALREAATANRERDQSEALRYVAEINAAFRDLEGGSIAQVRRRLADLEPQRPDQEDRRGFDWRLLQASCSGELRILQAHKDRVYSVSFAPDGRRLATAGSDDTAQLWDADTGRELAVLRGHDGSIGRVTFAIRRVAFAPDGRRLATVDSGGTVRLWDAATGRELLAIRGQSRNNPDVAFAPDGGRLATVADDGTARLWDAATGRELLTLSGHDRPVLAVAFAPSGQRLATSHDDGTIRLWDASPVDDAMRTRREAVGLVHFLLEQVESEVVLRERITRDATISDPVRSLALELADPFWRARIRRRAEAINASLFARLLLRDDVLAALRADASLEPTVRAEALAQAAEWLESVGALCEASRAVADEPGRPEAAYRQALRQAEAACRTSADRVEYLFALGVAQYRAGYPREALATLRRATDNYRSQLIKLKQYYTVFLFGVDGTGRGTGDPNELASSAALVPPDFIAYQAMAHHRLGEPREARAALELLRRNYESTSMLGERSFRLVGERGYSHPARLREAEALILGPPPELPEDVFAR
jgi:hypothetical protein